MCWAQYRTHVLRSMSASESPHSLHANRSDASSMCRGSALPPSPAASASCWSVRLALRRKGQSMLVS